MTEFEQVMSDFETNYIFEKDTQAWLLSNKIDIPNRAMNFGDGLFESMAYLENSIRYSEKHLKRLKTGLDILNMSDEDIDFRTIEKLLRIDFPSGNFRIRWNIFRSESGTYTPSANSVTQTLQIREFIPPQKIKKSAYISDKIRVFPTVWSNAKTLNSLPYVLANKERADSNMDEVILLDYRGFVSEAGSSNIFWKTGADVFTPSLNSSCVAGVGRAAIIEEFKTKGIEIIEGLFLPEHLAKASTVWVSNAMGISYLENIGGVEYSTVSLPFLEKVFS